MLKTESSESREMFKIYQKYLKSKATQEEIDWANEQLRDLFKTLGIGVVLILPFAPLTFPLIVSLSKRLGVELIPKSYYSDEENESLDT
ncbi:MAG: hypothetical protein VX341_08940 [Bdellovibrionota bacterium]|nr:hypothetical protein [Bdellovibrionota bacterium]